MADKAFYTAWAEVAPDFSKFGREVDRGFRDALTPAGVAGGDAAGAGLKTGLLGSVAKLAVPLAAAFSALNIGQMFVDTVSQGVSQANDLQQTTSAIQTVFGDASGAVEQFAQDAVTGLGITQQQALEASQMFGTFGKAAGLTGDDLSSFSTELGTLGADLAAFYGGDIQTALDAISSGLRGESEPLRQFGVLLDDATLKQRAMTMGIFDGKGALTQQQRVLAAQAEILAQTADAQGQAAREGESYDGVMKRLGASWEMVVTTLGTAFLPLVTEVVSMLNDEVIPVFMQMAQEQGPALAKAFADILPDLMAMVQDLLPLLPDMIRSFADALPGLISFLGALTPILTSLMQSGTDWSGVMSGLFALLTGDVSLEKFMMDLLNLTGPIGDVLRWGFDLMVGFNTWFTDIVVTVSSKVDEVITFIRDLPARALEALGNLGEMLVQSGRDLMDGFIQGIKDSPVGDAVNGVMDIVAGFFPHSPAERGPFSGSGWTGLKKSGGALYDQFMSGFGGDDPTFPAINPQVRVPRPAPLDDIAGAGGAVGAGAGGPLVAVYPQPGMSEETIGNVAATRIASEWRGF